MQQADNRSSPQPQSHTRTTETSRRTHDVCVRLAHPALSALHLTAAPCALGRSLSDRRHRAHTLPNMCTCNRRTRTAAVLAQPRHRLTCARAPCSSRTLALAPPHAPLSAVTLPAANAACRVNGPSLTPVSRHRWRASSASHVVVRWWCQHASGSNCSMPLSTSIAEILLSTSLSTAYDPNDLSSSMYTSDWRRSDGARARARACV
jgi:hypothetical protein